jgi:hypothetical protein
LGRRFTRQLAAWSGCLEKGYDAAVFLYAFDLIELDGDDLRCDPLAVRKATLASLLARAAPGLRFHAAWPWNQAEATAEASHVNRAGGKCLLAQVYQVRGHHRSLLGVVVFRRVRIRQQVGETRL